MAIAEHYAKKVCYYYDGKNQEQEGLPFSIAPPGIVVKYYFKNNNEKRFEFFDL